MSPPVSELTIDKEALLAKYVEERDKRLRTDGTAQYQRTEGVFERYKLDVQGERNELEPIFYHVTFAFFGGGFAGLVTGARLA